MTLGEKIRHARKSGGLSQEQLGEKMCVSRSAIAKWETGKGMPDVENLKILARLLNVSMDSLLDDSEAAAPVREAFRLADFGRGCEKVQKDRMMRRRFPGAVIESLLGRPELTEQERVVDSARGILTPDPFGAPEFLKSVRKLDRDFYLVEQDGTQLFVTVTREELQIQPLSRKQVEKTFRLGNWLFIRCGCVTEE